MLNAARELFAREGYAGAGMEMVAKEAQVSTATLYAYFPSKADLFRVMVEETVAEGMEEMTAATSIDGDARTRLRAFAAAYARHGMDPMKRAVLRIVAAERRRFEDCAAHLQTTASHAVGATLLKIIADLVANDELRVPRPSWAAGQLLGMIEHVTLVHGLMSGDSAAPRHLAEICDDAVETFLARYGVRDTAAG